MYQVLTFLLLLFYSTSLWLSGGTGQMILFRYLRRFKVKLTFKMKSNAAHKIEFIWSQYYLRNQSYTMWSNLEQCITWSQYKFTERGNRAVVMYVFWNSFPASCVSFYSPNISYEVESCVRWIHVRGAWNLPNHHS